MASGKKNCINDGRETKKKLEFSIDLSLNYENCLRFVEIQLKH